MNDTEALIKTHPRDKLLIMRQNEISRKRAEKIKEREQKRQFRQENKATAKIKQKSLNAKNRVRNIEESERITRKFSSHYLGTWGTPNFSPRERLELFKICTSYCRRWLTVFASPIIATSGAILYSGLFTSAVNFILLPAWMAFAIIYLKIISMRQDDKDIINFFDYIHFLWYRKLLIENENNKSSEKYNFTT